MNIIFLTMVTIDGVKNRGIYTDLMRKYRDEGHGVYIVCPRERCLDLPTELVETDGVYILGVRTLNLQKTSVIEKGIGQISVEFLFTQAVKKYLGKIQFDIILYSTPPITFTGVVRFLKCRNTQAIRYLLLKDIFPQNAVDLGMFGAHGLISWWFRRKEVSLYRNSDFIGCMSPANASYLLCHNRFLQCNQVEVAPNSIELNIGNKDMGSGERIIVREHYGLPTNKPIFIYGGNLGKPQGINFIIECLDAVKSRDDCHFLIVGDGTEYARIEKWQRNTHPDNISIIQRLPKNEYDQLVQACDVGLIFLDYRFTIPNYPSRLLSYLESHMPIIACTDAVCDMGPIAEANGYGYWCGSNSVEAFNACVDKMLDSDVKAMGENGYEFLCKNYLVDNTYNAIMSHV